MPSVLPKVIAGVFWNYVDAVNHCRPVLLAPPALVEFIEKTSNNSMHGKVFHFKEQLGTWKCVNGLKHYFLGLCGLHVSPVVFA